MTETFADRPLLFTIPGRHARGRLVRLDAVLGTILSAHDYPPVIRRLVSEAVTIAALMGTLLKEADGQLTLQAQTQDGPVELLVADYRGGELRGHARFDAERLATLGDDPDLPALFGQGFLAITFDLAATGQRYQGVVPLEGRSLAEACSVYFVQSEQVPTLILVAVDPAGGAGGRARSGGFVVQHLAEGEEGRERLHVRLDHPEWEHVAALSVTLSDDELLDPALSLEHIVWRLFHEEEQVRVSEGPALSRGCRCTMQHFRDVIGRFPLADRQEMIGDDGVITIDCAFCSRKFALEPHSIDG